MSQSASPHPATATVTVTHPAAFSLALIHTLLSALPGPDPLHPAPSTDRLRQTLLLVQELAPRTVLQGMLVQQIVLGMAHGPLCAMQATLAARAGNLVEMARFERLALAHGRQVGNLMRQRAAQRAASESEGTEPHTTWNLAELEAMWRRWHAPPEVAPAKKAIAGVDVAALAAMWRASATPAKPATAQHPDAEADPALIEAALEAADAAADEQDPAQSSAWPLSRQQRRALERMRRKMAVRLDPQERAAA